MFRRVLTNSNLPFVYQSCGKSHSSSGEVNFHTKMAPSKRKTKKEMVGKVVPALKEPVETKKRKTSQRKNCAPNGQPPTSLSVIGQRLDDAFYETPCEDLARRFLGQILVRALPDGERLTGRIVETEAYPGGSDMASCSFQGRQTSSNAGVFMKPGTAYVYMTYGMYHCFNVSSGGHGSAVLLRALEPLSGLETMRRNRGAKRKDGGSSLKDKDLCSGPSKLCMALGISKQLLDQRDLVSSDLVWIERGDDVPDTEIVAAPRVGIGPRALGWRTKPFRFYVQGNANVSIFDQKAEGAT